MPHYGKHNIHFTISCIRGLHLKIKKKSKPEKRKQTNEMAETPEVLNPEAFLKRLKKDMPDAVKHSGWRG